MDKPRFSICLIAKNEAKTLPRFVAAHTTQEFIRRGGEICLLDTGSTDDTVKIAREAGFVVKEVGAKHIHYLSDEEVEKINKMFVVDNEEAIVQKGQKFFNFSAARNEAAELSSNDIVSFVDADEIFTVLNIDEINKLVDDGVDQFEYNFVFAHDAYGNEAVKFVQSKMYNKTKIKWHKHSI